MMLAVQVSHFRNYDLKWLRAMIKEISNTFIPCFQALTIYFVKLIKILITLQSILPILFNLDKKRPCICSHNAFLMLHFIISFFTYQHFPSKPLIKSIMNSTPHIKSHLTLFNDARISINRCAQKRNLNSTSN